MMRQRSIGSQKKRKYRHNKDANKFNRTKLILLELFYNPVPKHLKVAEITLKTGLPEHSVRQKMTDLVKGGYVWRRAVLTKGRNKFEYRYLKPKGMRIYLKLLKRKKIEDATGIFVPLNLDKPIPAEAVLKYSKLISKQ